MGDRADDPIDHSRTTRPRAGETMKNTAKMPGLVLIGLAVAAFVMGLYSFADDSMAVGIGCVVIAAAAFTGGSAWLVWQTRRVNAVEDRWFDEHPDAPHPPSTS